MLRRLLDSPWPYFVGAGLLLIVAIASQLEIRMPSRPVGRAEDLLALRERGDLNVVFILVDTLRADRLSAYGYERPTSENLKVLADQGVRFRNVIAQSSWTKSSMASLWTGTHAVNNGILRYMHVLPDAAVLPAERFKESGYRTVGIWRNGWVAPNFGFDQGFEFYLNPKAGAERQRIQRGHPGGPVIQGTDEDLLTAAYDFLDHFGREQFFLYLHFMDLHQYVYDEAASRFGTSYSDVYDQSIHWTDRLIGALVNRIEEMGLRANTIFVIGSDHGEAFREHGMEGHARNLYSEVIQVPFVISLPFVLQPGIVVEERVSNIDLWPTILDLVGLPPLENPDGRSLVPLMLAAAGAGEGDELLTRPAIAYLERSWGSTKDASPMVAVTDGDLRLTWWKGRPNRPELYDLAGDPGEQNNIYSQDDPEAQRLLRFAQEHLESGKTPWTEAAGTVELDELRLNQLRALGYMIR
jgi:arylsulfatase A-like enzyme